ncbi:MAG: hypothetical protein FWD66_01150 [Paludibacter sp.]|nr:hypothetical protein [Paludibacter sp.]
MDLKAGIALEIGGELGKNNSISANSLAEIAMSFQSLIHSLVKYDLPSNEPVDVSNFNLELFEFKSCCAVPAFRLRQTDAPFPFNYDSQVLTINERLDVLFSISDEGNYMSLMEIYPEPFKRNEITDSFYKFASSFKDSPVKIYQKGILSDKTYKLKKFNEEIKKELITPIIDSVVSKEEDMAVGTIKVIKRGNKIEKRVIDYYSKDKNQLSYSPQKIEYDNKIFSLNYPLRCLFEKENSYYVITNEQLDIIGTGMTDREAEINFNEEFVYLYDRLNSLSDDKLTKRLVSIKFIMNNLIKEINDN